LFGQYGSLFVAERNGKIFGQFGVPHLFGSDFAFKLLDASLKSDDLLVDGGLLALEGGELLLKADVFALLKGGLDHELLFHAGDVGGEIAADVPELDSEAVTASRVGVLDAGNDGLLAGKFVILRLERRGEVLDHAADTGSVLRLIHDEIRDVLAESNENVVDNAVVDS